jgi:hypothetical protein
MVDIFWGWKKYREHMRGRRLSYPRLVVFLLMLAVGFYGYRWATRYMAAREAAKLVRCDFHQEVPLVKYVEDTETIINRAVCASKLKPAELWAALTDFGALTQEPYRAPSVNYAHYLTSSNDLQQATSRLPEEVRNQRDFSDVDLGSPRRHYVYQEHKQIGLIHFWSVVAYQTRLTNEAEGIYELEFAQPDGLGDLEFYRGRIRLEPNPEGSGTRITFVLRQAMPYQLAGEGLVAMASRMIVMDSYLNGFHPFMENVVAGLERLARERAGSSSS